MFHISNFRDSLEQVAREYTDHITKWKQEPVFRQATILEVTSIRRQNDIKKLILLFIFTWIGLIID